MVRQKGCGIWCNKDNPHTSKINLTVPILLTIQMNILLKLFLEHWIETFSKQTFSWVQKSFLILKVVYMKF